MAKKPVKARSEMRKGVIGKNKPPCPSPQNPPTSAQRQTGKKKLPEPDDGDQKSHADIGLHEKEHDDQPVERDIDAQRRKAFRVRTGVKKAMRR